jgi:hypothetical protein
MVWGRAPWTRHLEPISSWTDHTAACALQTHTVSGENLLRCEHTSRKGSCLWHSEGVATDDMLVGGEGRQEAGRGKKEGRRGEAEPPVPFHIHSLLAKAKGKPRKG